MCNEVHFNSIFMYDYGLHFHERNERRLMWSRRYAKGWHIIDQYSGPFKHQTSKYSRFLSHIRALKSGGGWCDKPDRETMRPLGKKSCHAHKIV